MIRSTLLTGVLLLSGLGFAQTGFQKHVVPEPLMRLDAIQEDVATIRNLEQQAAQSAATSRTRGSEVDAQLQSAYREYLSHLDLMLDIVVKDEERKMIANEQKFVTTLIH